MSATVIPLRLLLPADRPTRSAPRPSLLTAAGRYDGRAIMALAHSLARDDVADAARRGRVRRYKIALRDALPAAHSAIVAERTAALMIDSTRRMVVELSAIDVRAAAEGVRL